jgi:hypothetical protein
LQVRVQVRVRVRVRVLVRMLGKGKTESGATCDFELK